MNKKRKDLFNLILSLNKSELRYFTIFSKSMVGKKDHLKLFKVIQKQLVQKSAKDINFTREVAEKKNINRTEGQLKNSVLASLRSQHAKHFIEVVISQLLYEAKLLKKKGLTFQAIKHIEEAKNKAIRYECYYNVCEAIDFQLKIAMNNVGTNVRATVLSLHEEKKHYIYLINLQEEFEKYRHLALLYYRKDSSIQKEEIAIEVEKLLDLVLKSERRAVSFFSRRAYLHTLSLIYRLKGDKDNMLRYHQKMIELWEMKEHKHLKEAYMHHYKVHIYNYLSALHLNGDYQKFNTILDKIENYESRFLEEIAEDFQNVDFLLLLKYLNTGEWKNAGLQVKKLEEFLENYDGKIEQMIESRKITIKYNIAIYFFLTYQFEEAAIRFQELQSLKTSKEQRLDLKHLSRIFSLLIVYERTNNWEKVDYYQKSTQKFFQRRGVLLEFEKMILSNIKTLNACHYSPKQETLALRNFEQELKIWKMDRRIRYGIEEIQMWINYRLSHL